MGKVTGYESDDEILLKSILDDWDLNGSKLPDIKELFDGCFDVYRDTRPFIRQAPSKSLEAAVKAMRKK